MADWHFAQTDPSEELAQLHHFSMKKRQPAGNVEFVMKWRNPPRGKKNLRMLSEASAARSLSWRTRKMGTRKISDGFVQAELNFGI